MTPQPEPRPMPCPLRRLAAGALLAGLLALWLPAAVAAQSSLITLREPLVIVTSESVLALTERLAQAFVERHAGAPAPVVEADETAEVFRMFCAGLGPETPDIAIATRRMPRAVYQNCRTAGVREIIEVQVGLGAVVLAARRGDPATGLSARQLWQALAAELPEGEGFRPNPHQRWSELDPALPAQPIRVLVPPPGSGTRAMFEDLMLEAGCRYVPQIRSIFEAEYRRAKCITLRADGPVREVATHERAGLLLSAPPGTLAILSYAQVLQSGGNLVPLALDGVVPNVPSMLAMDYWATRVVYLYAKREHARTVQGVGVVRGIQEWLLEATSEQAAGPGGYLATSGLVPLSPADREAQRRTVTRQRLMSP